MENLKILVNNEAESREVQELAFNLGITHDDGSREYYTFCSGAYPQHINLEFDEGFLSASLRGCILVKEITLPQLRDMVVLKRNDVGDATHTDQNDWKWYIGEKSYVWNAGNAEQLNQWDESRLDRVALKPIEKSMKEYLAEVDGIYQYRIIPKDESPCEGWIEIPKGADYMTMPNFYFWRDHETDWAYCSISENWDNNDGETMQEYLAQSLSGEIVWQRKESVNDRCVVDSESKQKTKSISYTLAERQSTYGGFEDVAFVTEGIMGVLSKVRPNGLNDLPQTHRMALYMIASKMARIVNGDFNYKDSWHDIGGYAKLIDDLIGESK